MLLRRIARNPYIPWSPTETQLAFLLCDAREALYGGAAGGGKSVALLMAALMYVDVPGYHALLLRRTFAALAKPGALMDLASEWLSETDAVWNATVKQWTFPSGATLSFGYLDSESDKYQYQGAAYQFIGFDELTQFTSSQYRYLFSRKRRNRALERRGVPMRTRAASNPGGVGHEWVFDRFFVEGDDAGRVFIPALMQDNPHLDVDDYRSALAELDPVERRQLEHGDWTTRQAGDWFNRSDFEVVDSAPIAGVRWVRYWDTASTKPKKGSSPDYTVGVLMGERGGTYWVRDVQRFRLGPAESTDRIAAVAKQDGVDVEVFMEKEPGSQSSLYVDSLARGPLKGFSFRGVRVGKDKVTRAKPLAAAVSQRRVKLVRARWNKDFLDELEAFPTEGVNDDQVDGSSGAFARFLLDDDSTISSKPVKAKPRGLAAMSL